MMISNQNCNCKTDGIHFLFSKKCKNCKSVINNKKKKIEFEFEFDLTRLGAAYFTPRLIH